MGFDLSKIPIPDVDEMPIPEKDAFSKIQIPDNKYLEVYDDHINIDGTIPVMRVPYYNERLDDLESFDGFVARWYIPGEKLYFKKSDTTAIITVMILDTAKEIKVGVGYDWPPVVLGRNEMQLQDLIANLMGAQIGDEIHLPLDFSYYMGDMAVMKLFAIMVAQIDDAYVNFSDAVLTFADLDIPLETFGIDANTFAVELIYTLKSTYERPNGKFSLIFSNAALVDCHYIFPSFLFSLEMNLEKIKDKNPELYEKAKEVLDKISDWLTVNDVTFCDFGYDLNGVLKD